MFPGCANKKVLYLNDRHEENDTEQESRQKLYDKRILPLLNKNDLVIFGGKIDPFLWKYYRRLGLATVDKHNIFYVQNFTKYPSLTKAVVNNPLIIKAIKKRNPDVLMPYIASKDTRVLAQRINTHIISDFRTVEYFNNKANHRQVIMKLDFPMIPGFRVSNLEDAKMHLLE